MVTKTEKPFDPHIPTMPAAEKNSQFDPWWWLVVGVIGLTVTLCLVKPDPFWRIVKFVKEGLVTTVIVTLITFALVLVVGLVGALGRLSKVPIIRGIATIYVECVRGVPILVQLYFWYFAFPSIVRGLGDAWNIPSLSNYLADPIAMAVLGLTVGYAAYMTEVYRSGIQAISKGQMEAARSLGMTYVQAMRYVILPQAVRVILPPVGNEFITLLKDSSLVSAVAVPDLTRRGREFTAITPVPLQTWIMVGLLYLILTLFSVRLVSWIERKTRLEK